MSYDYKILTDTFLGDLEKRVKNKVLEEGYYPIGGVSVSKNNLGQLVYAQSLQRDGNAPTEEAADE